jgi:rfaE bifunctional protein kinase chain/domain
VTPFELVEKFAGVNVAVLGDLMLDEYIFGSANRISPEAPVMVIRQSSQRFVPGGAANVALNLAALGAKVEVIGTIGDDEAGRQLIQALSESNISVLGVVCDHGRRTTRKTRIVAEHSHQVLRVDVEDDEPIHVGVETKLLTATQSALEAASVLVLSDYLKGVMTPDLCSGVIGAARESGITTVANPKPRSAAQFAGASLVSLNRAEAGSLAGLIKPLTREQAGEVASRLAADLHVECVLITLGADGMVAAFGSDIIELDAVRVEVADPAGAGDTVIATVALGVSVLGLGDPTTYEAASSLAACVVRHVGVAVPSPEDILSLR